MKLKTLVLVVAILGVLALAAYYLQHRSAPTVADPRSNQPVLDARVLDKTAQIRLTDQGKTVVLARQPDGSWMVPSYYDMPADFAKLSRFINDLSSAKIQRFVTQNPERLARLEFKDASITLLDSSGHALWSLTLGKDAEGGGRFVRFSDENKGYLANQGLFLDSAAKNWIDSLLIDLKPDDIAGVEITFGDGEPVAATRAKKEDAWVAENAPAGQRIRSDRITSLLGSFTSLRFQDTSDLADADVEAARKHSRTVKLTTFDHKTITVEVGRKPEEKKAARGQKSEGGGPAAVPGSPEEKGQNPEPAAASPGKQEEPKTETLPAGPVFAFIASSDSGAAINGFMKKRAFQTFDWNFTSLPQKRDELFEPLPAPPSSEKKPEAAPAAGQAPKP